MGWVLQREGKRYRAGGRLPPFHSISPLCQWDTLFLQAAPPGTPPRAKGNGVSEAVLPAEAQFNT